jgi:Gpi18-like mannosyltransferase
MTESPIRLAIAALLLLALIGVSLPPRFSPVRLGRFARARIRSSPAPRVHARWQALLARVTRAWVGAPAHWVDALVLLALLLLALIPRLRLSSGGTFNPDRDYWFQWSAAATSGSFASFYQRTAADYLPGYIYVLWLLGHAFDPVQRLALSALHWHVDETAFFKLPAILADAATVVVLYIAGRRWSTPLCAAIAAAVYALNPAPILTSARWGQVDGVAALPLLLALVFLIEERPVLCGALLATSAFIKPTAFVLAPLCALVFLRHRRLRDLALWGGAFVATSLILVWPFKPAFLSLQEFLHQRLSETTNMWPYATINAFNLWSLFQNDLYQHDMIQRPDARTWLGISQHS